MATSKTKSNEKAKGKEKKTSASTKPVKVKSAKAGTKVPTDDEIRAKAQDIYNERILSDGHGTAEEDWLEAERLLRTR